MKADYKLIRENVPEELRRAGSWVCWEERPQYDSEGKPKKPRKMPINPRNGREASSTDPATWATFDEALAYGEAHPQIAGVGFVFTPDDPYAGIDFDNVIDDAGKLQEPWASYVTTLGSYTEISPSGRGLKVFVKAHVAFDQKHASKPGPSGEHAEFYSEKRFFTVTGMRFGDAPREINERTTELKQVYDAVMGPPRVARSSASVPPASNSGSIPDIEQVRSALQHVDPNPYETWRDVGFACSHSAQQDGKEVEWRKLYDDWSRQSSKFDEAGQERHWRKSMEHKCDRPLTVASIFQQATQNGWVRPQLPNVYLPQNSGATITECAGQLGGLLAATERYFNRGGVATALAPAAIGTNEPLRPMDKYKACSDFELVARLVVRKKHAPEPTVCGTDMAQRLLVADGLLSRLPLLQTVTNCPVPVIRKDGSFDVIRGYDPELHILAMGVQVDPCTLDEAGQRIDELLLDFDFQTQGDRSRAMGCLITPALVLGGILTEKHPAHEFQADQSQAGKEYATDLTAAIYGENVHPVVQPARGGVGSLDEGLDTALIGGANFISIANVRDELNSKKLESAITENLYQARAPYGRSIYLKTRRTNFFITTNGKQSTRDLANRVSIICIRKRPKGYTYRKYPEGHLLNHVRASSATYLAAVYALIREWHRRGCPSNNVSEHDFREWAGVADWIVQTLLGGATLMEGMAEAKARMLSPQLDWVRQVAQVVQRSGRLNDFLHVHELAEMLMQQSEVPIPGFKDEGDPEDEGMRGEVCRAVGLRLSQTMRDHSGGRTVGGFLIMRQTTFEAKRDGNGTHNVNTYRFELIPSHLKSTASPPEVVGTENPNEPQVTASTVGESVKPIGTNLPPPVLHIFPRNTCGASGDLGFTGVSEAPQVEQPARPAVNPGQDQRAMIEAALARVKSYERQKKRTARLGCKPVATI